ncbi:uncharacterized protein LOC115540243 [Gadus morhua]|uniref:uncharacterized protein LOC115540243 n=1 Tax=Gadus morhua TaxID=8049 RepID=UPI0011B6B862|nr:uncharacterized protein LOC115540243 [Gadus morhua]
MPEGAELSECTADMDAVAFNAFTEFFTHTLSICHFLQSEAWQLRAETSMHSLTEASASVAEQLSSTRLLTEDLLEAQSSALLAQDQILLNGQELQHTIRESSQGVRELFSQVTDSSREQQVVLSELFNRISFLQSFVLLEAHTLSSASTNAAGLCTAFLLTCTPHTARSRLVLLGLVCVNVCLERLIYQYVMDSATLLTTHGAGDRVRGGPPEDHGDSGSPDPGAGSPALQRPDPGQSAGPGPAQRHPAQPAAGPHTHRAQEEQKWGGRHVEEKGETTRPLVVRNTYSVLRPTPTCLTAQRKPRYRLRSRLSETHNTTNNPKQ